MNISWKIVNLGAVAMAGLLSDSIVKLGWKVATGKNPPEDDDLEVGLAEIVTFAVLSGVLLAITKRFTVQAAAKWYNKSHPVISDTYNI
ncbi:DUF4235 domain-containing protein [Mobiluncus mulieris]|uniref:DUF4235 domain-containing protein n=2 Tax=Mobiluncus mulieris TaxID=2052 RepID=E0QMK9_9ACTO|nr:DUF4235 domain-containing protein [Mobiluncus mulieris]EEJ53151.1 hypothetical protein HMPREF0577_1826 [Mobiluncus mulieris ATCC 35243]EFM47263.1 hypothetical protein HMPREF0580_0123 [Mobiluncus mulieris ATCC 35239]EFN93584.1 hypothetical protein HMPREF9278_0411 [Mobiluncus mulieris FB024-16]MBB5847364.1 hypothetical protein [Mobiluncus mulieris]MCU9969036.1 DUF4235 domain-containing protein [Mobiluncus mulieris]